MGRIIDDCEVLLRHHVRVVSWGTHWPSGTEEVSFIESVERMFNHSASKFFVKNLIISILIESYEFFMSSKFEVHS